MKIELSLHEIKVLVKLLRMWDTAPILPLATTSFSLQEERVIQTLENWQFLHGDKVMPRWKLERTLGSKRDDWQRVLASMVDSGIIEFIRVSHREDGTPLPWRPSEGYKLAQTYCYRLRQKEQKVDEFDDPET